MTEQTNIKIWLDDIRSMPEGFDFHVKSYREAIGFIEMYGDQIELMSLDHDLGDYIDGREYTGYDVLLHIVQLKYDGKPIPKNYTVHSQNSVGVERMQGVIDRYLV